ncbi:MAG: single-stranded-DNA-specific exonuclease RecJ [Planctomycetaceae bacterium]
MRCSTLLAQVLLARGLTDHQQAKAFLSGTLQELQEPERMPGVEQAAELIVQAIHDKRRITIYGDYDVDGMTSTAILLQCLQSAGAEADYYIPCRLEEGYGLNCEAIRELHQADPRRLVVTVDCGISSLEEARLARELGLDLIITDHHQFGAELPSACAVVHPRIDPETSCFPELCGAGVAFKLAWAVCKQLGNGQRASERMRNFLKTAVGLAMIGTVADVVPLVGENRMIVKYGLETLRKQAGTGLRALLQVSGLLEKSGLNAEDIGFALAPRLNAAGRLGQARLAVELLVTHDEHRAAQLAEYLDGLNKQRQTVERKILKQAREEILQHPDWLEQPVLVVAHHEWHPGVIGIVASRVAEQFEKPTILITLGTGTSLGQGSGRSHAGFDLHAAVTASAEPLDRFGGHPAAIGLKIQPEQIAPFRELLNEVATRQRGIETQLPPRRIDSEVSLHELTVGAIQELEYLGPFGSQNERPVFVTTGIQLVEPPRVMGEGGRHLSLRVQQHGHQMRAIAFGRGEWAEQIEQTQGSIALCFKPGINEFRGRMNVELQLIDWKSDQEVFQGDTASSAVRQDESRTA